MFPEFNEQKLNRILYIIIILFALFGMFTLTKKLVGGKQTKMCNRQKYLIENLENVLEENEISKSVKKIVPKARVQYYRTNEDFETIHDSTEQYDDETILKPIDVNPELSQCLPCKPCK